MPINQPFSGAKRISFVQGCRLLDGAAEVEGTIRNISVLGVYLHVDPVPKVGERLGLRFELPDGAGAVEVEAEVAWRNSVQRHKVSSLPPGCGLRFLSLSDGDEGRIEALVRRPAPAAD
jgi:Tfp pilus assembly protein PilZ